MIRPEEIIQKKYKVTVEFNETKNSEECIPKILTKTEKDDFLSVTHRRSHHRETTPTNIIQRNITDMQKNLNKLSEAVDVQTKILSGHNDENLQDFEKRLESKFAQVQRKLNKRNTISNGKEKCLVF
ncbi:hypothetical protein SteCoe_4428 [Stentor coeruleus]|uniref:Uncharacterized protein n=1 Tax=Stentor coeruleus TaxID=5963 RepID=A0A1R2CUY4_9CILI|nr:hypothetical protein SteCoe_4428 [Stentor coeruleus]